MKNLLFLFFLFILLFAVSCQQKSMPTSQTSNADSETVKGKPSAQDEFHRLLEEARRLEAVGRSMETVRQQRDEGSLTECGNLMKPHRDAAKDLKEKANRLPPIYSEHLGSAAIEVELCISCSPTAIKSCDLAKSLIQEAEKQK